jgi:hypothetical protein
MLWLWLFFLLILGFGYSYFWSVSTIIYLLMRQKVDDTELDEVYLEEEQDSPYSAGATFPETKPTTVTAPASNVTMLETPTLRTPPKEEAPAPPPSGDGNPPPGESTS